MSQLKTTVYGAIFLCSLLLTPHAHAQDDFYAGLGLGQATSDACDIDRPCDDKSTAWKGLIGYNLSDNFAVELNYQDLGTFTGSAPSFDAKTELDVTLYSLLLVGSIDITDDFAIFGKLGTAEWSSDAKLIQPVAGDRYKDDGNGMTYALGVSWNFIQNQQLSLDWQTYDIEIEGILPIIDETADTDVISLVYTLSF